MVIEILSPSTASRDTMVKFSKYLQAGVREYWIVDPESKMVRVCLLIDGKYDIKDHFTEGAIPVNVLDGCTINMRGVFADIPTSSV